MTQPTRGKFMLLGLQVPMVAFGCWNAVRLDHWLGTLGLVVLTLACVGVVLFFFPDQTVGKIANATTARRDRRAAFRSGRLEYRHVNWLLTRAAATPADLHSRPGQDLYDLIVEASYADPEYGHVVQPWLRRGGDWDLLRNALVARLSPAVLSAHLDGSHLLDPTTVATLAALTQTGPIPAIRHTGLLGSTVRATP